MSGYDIIGDIHAHGTRLDEFLKKLGYRGFAHPEGRKIIFVGDFIDRGHEHKKTLETVQALIQEGTAQAVMGNHEHNAICYGMKGKNGYIRPHTPVNTGGLAQFFQEYPFQGEEYEKIVKFFRKLPIVIQKEKFSVVHACWNKAALRGVQPYMTKSGSLKKEAYNLYDSEKSGMVRRSIDILLRGPEFRLPKGVSYLDVSGVERHKCRVLWWEQSANQNAADHLRLIEKGDRFTPFGDNDSKRLVRLHDNFNKASQHIVFVGHYNLPVRPYLTSPNTACVNFKGHMVAYRWNHGDKSLSSERLVSIPL